MEEAFGLRRKLRLQAENLAYPRLDLSAEHGWGNELRFLRAVIIGVGDDIHHIAQLGQCSPPVIQFEFQQLIEQRARQRFIQRHEYEQIFHADDTLGELEDAGESIFEHHGIARLAIAFGLLAQAGNAPGRAHVGPGMLANGLDCGMGDGNLADAVIQPILLGTSVGDAPLVPVEPIAPGILLDHVPVVAVQGIEPACVHLQALQQVLLGQRQLLDAVAKFGLGGGQAQRPSQSPVGDNVNAGDLRAAQIEGRMVGHPVIEGGEQASA